MDEKTELVAKLDQQATQIEKLELESEKLRENYEAAEAKLVAEREDAIEKERIENEHILENLKSQHLIEIEKIKADYEMRLEATTNALNERLKNSEIDISSLKGNN